MLSSKKLKNDNDKIYKTIMFELILNYVKQIFKNDNIL